MKYDKNLIYTYGTNVVEGGVRVYSKQPAAEEAMLMNAEEFTELFHYKYVLVNPFTKEEMWSRRFKTFKEARVEGMKKLDELWEILESNDEEIGENDDRFIKFKESLTRWW